MFHYKSNPRSADREVGRKVNPGIRRKGLGLSTGAVPGPWWPLLQLVWGRETPKSSRASAPDCDIIPVALVMELVTRKADSVRE